MNPTYIIIIAFAVIVLAVILFLLLKRSKKKTIIDTTDFVSLFSDKKLTKIEYIRNKIVITFTNIKELDVDGLQQLGASSITIVGDKIKFIMNEDNELNIKYYESLKNHFER